MEVVKEKMMIQGQIKTKATHSGSFTNPNPNPNPNPNANPDTNPNPHPHPHPNPNPNPGARRHASSADRRRTHPGREAQG